MTERRPSPQRRLLVAAAVFLTCTATVFAACEDGDTSNPAPSGGTESVGPGGGNGPDDGDILTGPCNTEGETHECTAHNSAGCATGVQTCRDGAWSACEGDESATSENRDLDHRAGNCPIPPLEWLIGKPWICLTDDVCQFDSHCVAGSCEAWASGATHAAGECTGQVDIHIGVPCNDEIPVCNRGEVAAAANTVKLRSGPVALLPGIVGTLSNPAGSDCTIPVAIAAGACEMVPADCYGAPAAAQIDPGDWIFAHNVANECSDYDNWSYYDDDGTCGTCFGSAAAGPFPCDGTTISNNACDLQCQGFAPDPPAFGGAPADYGTGSFNNFSPSTINAGLPNNCDESANNNDCQFDYHCEANGNGECVPWGPGDTNPDCAGVDLQLGLPCADGIPICNRGNSPITTNFHLDQTGVWTPATINAGNPNIGVGPNCDYVVATLGQIAPGDCYVMPFDCNTPADPTDDLAPGDLVAAHGLGGECNTGDNFTYVSSSAASEACGEPSCSSSVSGAVPEDLTIMLLLDRTCSMGFTPGLFASLKSEVINFLDDPTNAGLGVVLKTFPNDRCYSPACDSDSPYLAAGTCAIHPCDWYPNASGNSIDQGCATDVTPAFCAANPTCCDVPFSAGSCAPTPCAASVTPMVDDCNPGVGNVCDDNGFFYCCGLAQPLQGTQAGAAKAWNTSLNICAGAAALNGGQRCYDVGGTIRDCNAAQIAAAPAGSLASTMRVFCAADVNGAALPDTRTCCRVGANPPNEDYSATCATAFTTYWTSLHPGENICAPATGQWDAACRTRYDAIATGSSDCTPSSTNTWTKTCRDALDVATGGSCSSCDHGEVMNPGVDGIDAYRIVLPDARLTAAVAAIPNPSDSTPMVLAFDGAVDFARQYMALHPTERVVVAATTDCNYSDTFVCPPDSMGGGSVHEAQTKTILSTGAAETPEILTFIIGFSTMSATAKADLDELAVAGGTGDATILGDPGEPTLSERLNQIASAFSCSYTIDTPVDPSLVTVQWNDGSATPPALTYVGTDDTGCTAGGLEYYMPGPTDIELCPDACTAIQADPSSNLQIVVDCVPEPAGGTSQTFSAENACDAIPGTYPKWTVMYYDATITESSSIAVNVRTAVKAGDPFGPWHPVDMRPTTVAGPQDMDATYFTEDLLDPPSLELALGTEAFAEEIEFEFVPTANTTTPVLDSYEVMFSCPFTE